MSLVLKIVLFGILLTTVTCQSSSARRPTATASSAAKTTRSRYAAQEQGRTLGVLRPILRGFGIGGSSQRPVQSDPAYGGGYGGYGGGYNGYGGYGGYGGYYPNYGGGLLNTLFGGYNPYAASPAQYGGYAGQGYVNPYGQAAYPNYATAATGYQPQRPTYGGVNNYATTNAGAGAQPNTAQMAQLAALLGQALGSSLRPYLANGGAAGAGTSVAAAAPGAAANPLSGLLGLLG